LRRHLAVPWPARTLDVREVPLVAVDFETTGLDPRRDQIVGAGWVQLRRERVVLGSACRRVVQPDGDLAPTSVVIHGISDDQAASGEPLQTVLEELLTVLAGAVLVAHHAAMDTAFLSAACERRFGGPWAGPSIDTLELMERRFRRSDRPVVHGALRLAAARRCYGLPSYPEHDALWDAVSAAELWLALAADLAGHGSLPLARVLRVLP
jgi:DNA polymerase-3 subunit epsilon